MVKGLTKLIILAGLILAVLISRQTSRAQGFGLMPRDGDFVSVDFYKQHFKRPGDFGFLNSLVFFSGQVRLNERATFVFEIPVSNFVTKDERYDDETLLGNPYLGGEFEFPDSDEFSSVVGRLGIHLPLAASSERNAALMGIYTTSNKLEYFAPDFFTFVMGLGFKRKVEESRTDFSVDFNGVFLVPDNSSYDNEIFLDYDVNLWFGSETFRIGFAFSGRFLATERYLTFGRKTFHQIGLAFHQKFSHFKPGVGIRVPLDSDISSLYSFIYSINLTYLI